MASSFLQQRDNKIALLVGIVVFSIYVISMPKTVALEDDSLFILSGYFNGVSHPPGYPVYTFIVHLFCQIPLGSIAARAHASSAFFGALTCAVFYLLFRFIGLRRLAAILLTLTFSLTATFWSQSIITEVYTLNCLLNITTLLLCLKIRERSLALPEFRTENMNYFYWISFLLGISMANHWPLTLLALPCYAILTFPAFIVQKRKISIVLLFLVCVSVPYLWMYINNQNSPEINFSGKFVQLNDFVDYILRSHYSSVDNKTTADVTDKIYFLQDFVFQVVRELNILLLFSVIGIFHLFTQVKTRLILIALIWLLVSNSLILITLLNFDYSKTYSSVFSVYPIVSIASIFVLSAFGLKQIKLIKSQEYTQRLVSISIIICLMANLYFSLPNNYRHNYTWGEEYANQILSEIPKKAILFADGEIELGLISYLHKIEGVRSDLRIFSSSGLLLENRFFPYNLKNKQAFLNNIVITDPANQFYVANNYYQLDTTIDSIFWAKLGRSDYGTQNRITEKDIALLLKWSEAPDANDIWTDIVLTKLRHRAIQTLVAAATPSSHPTTIKYIQSSLNQLITKSSDRLMFLINALTNPDMFDITSIKAQFLLIEESQLANKMEQAHFVYLQQLVEVYGQTKGHFNQTQEFDARSAACDKWHTTNNIYCSPIE